MYDSSSYIKLYIRLYQAVRRIYTGKYIPAPPPTHVHRRPAALSTTGDTPYPSPASASRTAEDDGPSSTVEATPDRTSSSSSSNGNSRDCEGRRDEGDATTGRSGAPRTSTSTGVEAVTPTLQQGGYSLYDHRISSSSSSRGSEPRTHGSTGDQSARSAPILGRGSEPAKRRRPNPLERYRFAKATISNG